jgi:hypothetical protein
MSLRIITHNIETFPGKKQENSTVCARGAATVILAMGAGKAAAKSIVEDLLPPALKQ